MKSIKLLHFIIFLGLSTFIFSQGEIVSHYGLEEGISQGAVRVILKDAKGFLWFGTQDGLNRFDGNSFKIFKHSKEDTNSICGNYINSLLEDGDKIWIGTANNGVCYYDKNLDIFTNIGISIGNCTNIEKDEKGNIYVAYQNYGLSIFTPKSDFTYERKRITFVNKSDEITALYYDKNPVFVGMKSGDLYSIDNLDLIPIIENTPFRRTNIITKLDSNLLVGTNKGVYIIDINNKTYRKAILDFLFEKLNNLVINDIVKVEDLYYFATDNGLYICKIVEDISFKVIKHLRGDINDKKSITSNRVYDLLLDEMLLWIGTNKLDLLSIEEPVFKTYNSKSEIEISNDFIFSIFKTEDYTFIGTRNGLNCIDTNGIVNVITKENTKGKLSYNVIRGINIDDTNNLWLSTTKGISIINLNNFDPQYPKIKTIYSNPKDEKSLCDNNTRSIFKDSNNRIWVATYGGGICLFTGNIASNKYSFKQFRHDETKNSISSDLTYNISQDRIGNYWISTKNGLNKLTYNKEPKFTIFKKDNGNIFSRAVLSTYQDLDNNLIWLGSHSGMYKFDLSNNTIKNYSHKEGLTNDVVYSILEDDNNKLWLSTNTGLFQFDKDAEVFRNFGINNGLQSSEFNLGAVFKAGKILYFGGVNGVNYFNPKDIERLYYEGDLKFTSLIVKDEEINPTKYKDIIDKNISSARKIILGYNQFPTYLRFSDFHFNKEKNSEFVYRLIPNDKNWNDLKGRKEIQLLNLPGGSYKLQVQGRSNNKFWDKKPLEIDIEVIPAWYKSNWAYFIYSLLLASGIFFIYRFQMEKKLNKRELFRLQEVAKKNIIINKALAEKEVLFKEIHHRVKNNLQVVSSILSLQERYLKNPKAIAAIKDSQSRIQAISLIHQKLYSDESIIAIRIKDYIDDLSIGIINSMEIDVEKVNYYSDIENLLLEVDTVTPIGLILNEIIINSIKHNSSIEKLNIEIKLFKDNESIVLTVIDNGKGVDKDFDYKKTDSYGMKLIESLSKKLKASIEFINEDGLVVKLVIRKFKEVF